MFDGESQKIQVLERFLADFWSKLGPKTAPRRAKSRPRPTKSQPKTGFETTFEKTSIFGPPGGPPILSSLWRPALLPLGF